MEFFEKFVVSDAFFPVLIGLLLVLVLVFVWILLSGKKKLEVQTNIQNIQNDDNVMENNPNEDVNDNRIIPVNIDDKLIEENVIVEGVEQNSNIEVKSDDISNVLVDIPINDMDETPVELTITENNFNDAGEEVIIEKTAPLVEDNISTDEIVEIEMPMKKVEDIGETVELPTSSSLINETDGETVELPVSKAVVSEVGEAAVAFESVPLDNREINENIKVEEPHEYNLEKTEIFDFPDFSDLETKHTEIASKVEEETMKNANEYVSAVFKEN